MGLGIRWHRIMSRVMSKRGYGSQRWQVESRSIAIAIAIAIACMIEILIMQSTLDIRRSNGMGCVLFYSIKSRHR